VFEKYSFEKASLAQIKTFIGMGCGISETAKTLGLSRQAVQQRMKLNNIPKPVLRRRITHLCRVCCSEYTSFEDSRRQRKPLVIKYLCNECKASGLYRCSKCGKINKFTEFFGRSERFHVGVCNDCHKRSALTWKHLHKKRVKEYVERTALNKKRRGL
jgi:hypothetical protein